MKVLEENRTAAPRNANGEEWVFIIDSTPLEHIGIIGKLTGRLAKTMGARVEILPETVMQSTTKFVHDRASLNGLTNWYKDKATREELAEAEQYKDKTVCFNVSDIEDETGRVLEFPPHARLGDKFKPVTGHDNSTYLEAVESAVKPVFEDKHVMLTWREFIHTKKPHGSVVKPTVLLDNFCKESDIDEATALRLGFVMQYGFGIIRDNIANHRGGVQLSQIHPDPENINPAGALNMFNSADFNGRLDLLGPKAVALIDARKNVGIEAIACRIRDYYPEGEANGVNHAPRIIVISDNMQFQNGALKDLEKSTPGRVMGFNTREFTQFAKGIDTMRLDRPPLFKDLKLDENMQRAPSHTNLAPGTNAHGLPNWRPDVLAQINRVTASVNLDKTAVSA